MKSKLLAVAVVVGALAWAVAPAAADTGGGGPGAAQIGVQNASTDQWAGAAAISKQNAVNANAPTNVAGGNITAGPSSANQLASSEAEAAAKNDADTSQKQKQDQTVGSGSCSAGCGGGGGGPHGGARFAPTPQAEVPSASDQKTATT